MSTLSRAAWACRPASTRCPPWGRRATGPRAPAPAPGAAPRAARSAAQTPTSPSAAAASAQNVSSKCIL